MSLLGSLLKKANTPVKPEAKIAAAKLQAAPMVPPPLPPLEKYHIGSKRKPAIEAQDHGSVESNGTKMTKLVPNPAQAAYMGPNLWDEVLTFGECSTLEFLNAEDFLFETGILLDSNKSGRSTPKPKSTPVVEMTPPVEIPQRPIHNNNAAAYRSSNSDASSTTSTDSVKSTLSRMSSDSNESVLRSMLEEKDKKSGPQEKNMEKIPNTDMLQKLLQGCSIPQDTNEGYISDEEEPAHTDADGNETRGSPSLPVIAAEINMSDRELHLATVPGEQVFNPKARRFENEELRPLPVMRKAKKQFVPEDEKDDKYWERRRKNNVAAKRARDAQRIKMNQIMVRTAWLEKENERLAAALTASLAEQEELKERLRQFETID